MSSSSPLQMNFSYVYDKIIKITPRTCHQLLQSIKMTLEFIQIQFSEGLRELEIQELHSLKDWLKACTIGIIEIDIPNLKIIEEINQILLSLYNLLHQSLAPYKLISYALCICDPKGTILNADEQFYDLFSTEKINYFDLIQQQQENGTLNVLDEFISDAQIDFYYLKNNQYIKVRALVTIGDFGFEKYKVVSDIQFQPYATNDATKLVIVQTYQLTEE